MNNSQSDSNVFAFTTYCVNELRSESASKLARLSFSLLPSCSGGGVKRVRDSAVVQGITRYAVVYLLLQRLLR